MSGTPTRVHERDTYPGMGGMYTTWVWEACTPPGYGGRREAAYPGMTGGGRLPTRVCTAYTPPGYVHPMYTPWYTRLYTTLCTPVVYPAIHHPMYTRGIPGYTLPCTPLGIPTILLYPGVPVPPYTGVALPVDEALGSPQEKPVGRRGLKPSGP